MQKATIFKDDIIVLLSMESRSNAKEVVMSFVKALNNEDFKTAKSYVSDNMSFLGPLASLDIKCGRPTGVGASLGISGVRSRSFECASLEGGKSAPYHTDPASQRFVLRTHQI